MRLPQAAAQIHPVQEERGTLRDHLKEMRRLRREGWKLSEIAEKFGSSRQRIHQLLGKTGHLGSVRAGDRFGLWVVLRVYDELCDARCHGCGTTYTARATRYLSCSTRCFDCSRAERRKLSDEDVADIVTRAGKLADRRRGGAIYWRAGIAALADEYGVSKSYMSRLINRTTRRTAGSGGG